MQPEGVTNSPVTRYQVPDKETAVWNFLTGVLHDHVRSSPLLTIVTRGGGDVEAKSKTEVIHFHNS